jgi:signal transduction histidine kinase
MQQGIKSIVGSEYKREEHWGISIQLWLSHALVACITVSLSIWLTALGLPLTPVLGAVLLIGGGLGLLLTWNMQYALFLLYETLTRLSQGIAVELRARAWWHWPFTESFAALTDLDQRIKQQTRQIQLGAQYRDHLLQHASAEAELEKRHRLARDLHDEITRQIFSISLSAAAAQAHLIHKNASNNIARTAVEEMQCSAKEVLIKLQGLRQQLHPFALEHDSLAEALQTLGNTLGYRTGAMLQITLGELPSADRLPRSVQELIFRIAQEACDNIAQHTHPQHVWLTLEQQGQTLQLEIRDDGQGFDLAHAQQGIGLAHIHEQTIVLKGNLSIQSQIGQGTTICVRIPLLLSLPERQDQLFQEWHSKHELARARDSIQCGEWGTLSALIIMILYISTGNVRENQLFFSLILLFSLCSAIYGYLRAHLILTKEVLDGKDHQSEVQALRLRLRNWRYGKYLLVLAGNWCFVTLLHGWHDKRIVMEVATASFGLLLLLVREYRAAAHAKRQYYARLSQAEIRWELYRWQQTLARRGRGWFLCIGYYILLTLGISGISQPPERSLRLFDHAPGIAIVLWGLHLLIATLIAKREARSLLSHQAQTQQCSKEIFNEA